MKKLALLIYMLLMILAAMLSPVEAKHDKVKKQTPTAYPTRLPNYPTPTVMP